MVNKNITIALFVVAIIAGLPGGIRADEIGRQNSAGGKDSREGGPPGRKDTRGGGAPGRKDARGRPSAPGRGPARSGFVVPETKRLLLILPFENDTGNDAYDYLGRGIARILEGRLKSFGHIMVREPAALFVLRPRAKKAPTGTAGPKAPGKNMRRIVLEVRRVRLDKKNYRTVKIHTRKRQARELGADYLLGGRILASDGKKEGAGIVLGLDLYDAHESRTKSFRHPVNPRSPFRKLSGPARDVFRAISALPPVRIRVATDRPGAMAYLDDLYLGRTPLEYRVVPGTYRLRVEQEGRKTVTATALVRPGAENVFRIENAPLGHRAGLEVKSVPAGVHVYLNHRYLGKTPLVRRDLPPGAHRLRLSTKGHIDRFIGVELVNDETKRTVATLRRGDTAAHYRDPGHVVLDWTYYDLSFYSLLTTLAFYGGWGYSSVRAERIAREIYPEVPVALIWWRLASAQSIYSAIQPYEMLYYQYLLDRNEARAHRYERGAGISAAAGILSLIAAGVLLYLGLDADERGFGEIGLFDGGPGFFALGLRFFLGFRPVHHASGPERAGPVSDAGDAAPLAGALPFACCGEQGRVVAGLRMRF